MHKISFKQNLAARHTDASQFFKSMEVQSKEEPRPICLGPAAALCDEMLLIKNKLLTFELAMSDRKQILNENSVRKLQQ